MRITGGKYKGQKLFVPPGVAIRPTRERVREAIFNILTQGGKNFGNRNCVEKAKVLDGFSGTGAMGLEAISRGAAKLTAIDNNKVALMCCRKNIEDLEEKKNTDTILADCLNPGPTNQSHSLIFLDPPYGLNLLQPAIEAFTNNGWIGTNAIIVLEMSNTEKNPELNNFTILDQREYGKTKILFLENHY